MTTNIIQTITAPPAYLYWSPLSCYCWMDDNKDSCVMCAVCNVCITFFTFDDSIAINRCGNIDAKIIAVTWVCPWRHQRQPVEIFVIFIGGFSFGRRHDQQCRSLPPMTLRPSAASFGKFQMRHFSWSACILHDRFGRLWRDWTPDPVWRTSTSALSIAFSTLVDQYRPSASLSLVD